MDPNKPATPNTNNAAPATAAAPAATPKLSLPTTWPGAFGIYKYSKQAVMQNITTVLVLSIISLFTGTALQPIFEDTSSLISLVLGTLFSIALTLTYLAGVRGQKISIAEALKKSLPLWLKGIGLSIIVSAALVVSVLLLVVPFFFVLPRVSLSFYYLVDKNMGVLDAFKASWEATKGHSGKVWGLIGVSILMAILVIVLVGIYFLIMYSAASALLYVFIDKQPKAAAPAPAPSTPVAPAVK